LGDKSLARKAGKAAAVGDPKPGNLLDRRNGTTSSEGGKPMASLSSQSGKHAPVTLVLGGARSGKSRFAESLLANAGQRIYLATAEARDEEMRERILDHQARRGEGWRTIEAPLDIATPIAQARRDAMLVDCLTLWLSNLMSAHLNIEEATAGLCQVLSKVQAPVVLVSNEVGLGIVPDNVLAREFRDHAGRLNQTVAAAASSVFFVAAGLPLTLKNNAVKDTTI
jgi:adenosylcobinamide kinase/adenosylcobinamide-phosphate guanylyltransferase